MSSVRQSDDGSPAELSVSQPTEHLSALYETAAESPLTPSRPRSRTSSIGSMTSDASYLVPLTFASRQHAMPSDVESSVGGDDGGGGEEGEGGAGGGVVLNTVGKEQLYRLLLRAQKRGGRYREKAARVIAAYREVERERDKVKVGADLQRRATTSFSGTSRFFLNLI